jgi:cytochrome c oxidase subunit 2
MMSPQLETLTGRLRKRRIPASAFTAVLMCFSRISLAGPQLQSMLHSMGTQASRVEKLWWIFFGVLGVIYLLVLWFLGQALLRRGGNRTGDKPETLPAPDLYPSEKGEKRMARVVGFFVGASVVVLFVFLISEFVTGRSLHALSAEPNPLEMKVTGHMWWWEVQYEDSLSSNIVTTANEIHLPVGRPVHIKLDSKDVIHSFWIPELDGKRDMVPGHPTSTWIKADEPGVYTGQCAEFCGYQHAHMRFIVTAESPAKFDKWLEAQRQTPPAPQTPQQKKGQDFFLRTSCILCHSISGTPAHATIGPNLSHIASRPTIAAGTLPNNRGNLGGWILDAQHIKPGCKMPQNPMSSDNLEALLDYIESLR